MNILVQRPATAADISNKKNRFLIPVEGGHVAADFSHIISNSFVFVMPVLGIFAYDYLDNIYLMKKSN